MCFILDFYLMRLHVRAQLRYILILRLVNAPARAMLGSEAYLQGKTIVQYNGNSIMHMTWLALGCMLCEMLL